MKKYDSYTPAELEAVVVQKYETMGEEKAKEAEASWSGDSLPSEVKDVEGWMMKTGPEYAQFLDGFLTPKEKQSSSSLAIGFLFEASYPGNQVKEDLEVPMTQVSISALREASDQMYKAHKLVASLMMEAVGVEGDEDYDPSDIDMINQLAPHADEIKKMSGDMFPLSASSFVFRHEGKMFLADSEKEVSIPLSDEDLKKMLENEGLDEEEVEFEVEGDEEAEGVSSKATLKSMHGIPLWFNVSEDYAWSSKLLVPAFKDFYEK